MFALFLAWQVLVLGFNNPRSLPIIKKRHSEQTDQARVNQNKDQRTKQRSNKQCLTGKPVKADERDAELKSSNNPGSEIVQGQSHNQGRVSL